VTVRLAASGKLFLAGEYAVLDPGRPALVVGIDWKMHAMAEPGASGLQILHRPSGLLWDGGQAPAELRFAARAAVLAMGFCGKAGGVRISFEDDLSHGGRKLGLGGSAAASVLAVRAVCALAGRRGGEEEILALAAAAHWAEQGGSGSGADVAAAALGGILEVRSRIAWQSAEEVMVLPADRIAASRPLEVRRVAAPPELRLLLVDTGAPANTRFLVREVRVFARGAAARWQARAGEISAAEGELRDALESRDAQSALDAVRRGAAAMAALGEDAGVPIVTPELAKACALASAAGAAGKPSGAGGGDCAVVLAFGDEARDRAEAALRPHFPVFRVSPGGLRD
jgi:phosphomevalonate kinase